MDSIKCPDCPLRAKYDKKPKSFVGRFWKFHIKFCPGWKAYLQSLDTVEREALQKKYGKRKL